MLLASVVAGAAGAWVVADALVRRVQSARLPSPPQGGASPAPVAAQIAEADRAARQQPTSAAVVGDLAMAYHASALNDYADQVYTVAEELSTEWRWTYYRGLLHEEHGRQVEAAEAFTRVVAADSSQGLAWFHLGEIAFKGGRLDAADEAYTHALGVAQPAPFTTTGVTRQAIPLSAYASFGLARVALERGDVAQAVARLQSVVSEQPRFGSARTLLRQLQATASGQAGSDQANRVARAYVPPADPLLDAVVARSRQSDLLLKHVALAARGGDQGWREFLIRRAVEFNPGALDVLLEMAATLQSAGKHDQALEFLRQAEKVAPDDHHVLVEQGKTLSDLGRLEEAERVLRRAIRVRDAAAEYNLGTVLDRLGREDEAHAHYQQALTIDSFHVRSMNNLGIILDRNGQTPAAMALFARALRVNPDDAEVLSNVGAALLNQHRYAEAARSLETALSIDARSPDARNNLGIAFAQTGRIVEARQQFQEALRLDPRHEGARRNLEALDGIGK
jgi:Flp pilus assembly protein TadD